jgi:hypothetical protein
VSGCCLIPCEQYLLWFTGMCNTMGVIYRAGTAALLKNPRLPSVFNGFVLFICSFSMLVHIIIVSIIFILFITFLFFISLLHNIWSQWYQWILAIYYSMIYNILEKYHRCMKDGQYHDLIKTYPTYIHAKRQICEPWTPLIYYI